MNTTTRFHDFQTLKALGADPLTDNERRLRRLPIAAVKTLESVFQPREMEDAGASGKHLDELKRVLHEHGRLDQIWVLKVGGEWLCIDGHHRLDAYRSCEGKRTHVPVKVFVGSLEEALRASIAVNAPDKLNLTKEDKLEAAWGLVVLGGDSVATIRRVTTIAERTVKNMRRGLERARGLHPGTPFEEWKWAKVKELLRGEIKEGQTMWHDVKAKEWAAGLARHFGGLPSTHPRVFAQALLRYNAETAKAIAEEILDDLQRGKVRADEAIEGADF